LRVAAQVLELREVVESGEPGEVAARAEHATAAGEQDRARLVLALELAEEARELAVEQRVDGVARAGRVLDRDLEHVAVARDAEPLVVGGRGPSAHGSRSFSAATTSIAYSDEGPTAITLKLVQPDST